jgi:hypothetical protein
MTQSKLCDFKAIRSALRMIPNTDDYELWVAMSSALQNSLGQDGFEVYRTWSSKSENHRESSTSLVWELLPDPRCDADLIFSLAYLHITLRSMARARRG